jgi:hypothetical protein
MKELAGFRSSLSDLGSVAQSLQWMSVAVMEAKGQCR